jgi:hypothetical protein
MIPTDIRKLTWDEIREHLAGPRQMIWEWLVVRGPATTSVIAEGTGINLLTVRPRVTELVQLGFAECIGRERREGVYRAVDFKKAREKHAETPLATQLPFKF